MRNLFPLAALSACLLLSGASLLAQGTTTLPPLAPARPLHLPNVQEKILDNGLRIVLLEDQSQPALWIRLALPAGTIRDTPDKVGLAQMTAALLDKGTPTRNEAQIADTIDGIGASLGASADEDYFTVAASGLSLHTDILFQLLSDISLHPLFPQAELDNARTRTLTGYTSSLAEGGALADAALHRLIYGGHPYGNYSSGTPKTLPNLTQADVKAFHATYFAPNVATLFVTGDITLAQATQKAQAAFGSWAKKEVPALPAPPRTSLEGTTPQIYLIDRPGAAQTEVRIGVPIPGSRDPNRPTGLVAMAVLGLGQFEGRLTREIRVKRGLTYGAASVFSRNAQAGEFEISTFTKNASTGKVVKIALDEARKLAQEPTPAGELQDRKDFMNGSFAISTATPTGLLSLLQRSVLYGTGPEALTEYTDRIQAVTPRQITELMKGLNLQAPIIVLVGDAKEIEPQVKALGTVTIIPASAIDLQSPTLQGDKPKTTNPGGGEKEPPTPAAQEAGKSLLAAAVKAHGGDAFLNLKSMTLRGKGEISVPGAADTKFPLESVALLSVIPGKSRLEMKTPFGDVIFATTGEGKPGWVVAPTQGTKDLPAGRTADPTDLLRRAVKGNFAVKALPDIENGKQHGFAITDDKGETTDIYVDAKTGLVSRVTLNFLMGKADFLLSAYHLTDGVQLPGKLEVKQGEQTFLSATFENFGINKPVDDALFVKPKE